MPDNLSPETLHDCRHRSSRTNLLLSGTIEASDVRCSVRIRNLSEAGALLEGAALPKAGEYLVLRRLNLEMGATVIWSTGSRCGITFEGTISVDGWRAGSWIAPRVLENPAQADKIRIPVASKKLSYSNQALRDPSASAFVYSDQHIADELSAVQQLLEKMADRLSEDVGVGQRHPMTRQDFDLPYQILGRLIDRISTDNRGRSTGTE